MAKFRAGDYIVGDLQMSDGTTELKVFLVNRVDTDSKGVETYSLDNGDGWTDGKCRAKEIDPTFEVC